MFFEQRRKETTRVRLRVCGNRFRRAGNQDLAAGPWSETPFIDRAADPQARDGRGWQFLYTGFIQVGAQRFAIVNGREYQENDPVGTGEFRVESIQPEHVTLISKTGGRRMTLALHAPKARKEPK